MEVAVAKQVVADIFECSCTSHRKGAGDVTRVTPEAAGVADQRVGVRRRTLRRKYLPGGAIEPRVEEEPES